MTELEIARESIKRHEGYRAYPYDDSTGLPVRMPPPAKLTIGYGRNLESVGLRTGEAELMLDADLKFAHINAQEVYGPRWSSLSTPRRAVVIEMAFQLGRSGLAGFSKFLDRSRNELYNLAADEMLDSRWARQTPGRAQALAERYRRDVVPTFAGIES